MSALAVSGLPTARFSFEGFLSVKRTSRMEHLEAVREDPRTLIFYEAPHKLVSTLADMLEAFGDRRIALARELTKVHEEVRRTTLAGAAAHYAENPPRGEFVLIVEGAPPKKQRPPDFREAVELTLGLAGAGGLPVGGREGGRRRTGYKKGELYKAALKE